MVAVSRLIKPLRPSSIQRGGFTLIEIIACIAILLILSALLYGTYGGFLSSAGNARCIANLRALHSGFTSYVNENGYWPQSPEFDIESDAGMLARGKWWITTLKPYVESTNVWICPAATPALTAKGPVPEGTITYAPTIFDAWPRRPFQWATMPWVVEVGGFHPGGGNVLFPDGSVRSSADITDAWK